MKIKIVYTNKALKDLDKLGLSTARQIVKKIGFYSKKGNPLLCAKKLKPPFDDLFRFRIGDYRVIFEVDNKGNLSILTILMIKHRKDVY
ncbi:type II toxin-antitoxin system RelE/ParE family toxin [Patescibacteria group bacterium]|nr:type II toxin-antitoxin system RelE/ParE family toxin [Patescibacteria group bacterium]